MKKYIPNPINIDGIELSSELTELTEAMAKNIHEVWAAGRIAEGWGYGNERTDKEKLHPGLVPYEELSEQEKEYDRATSISTLKLIMKLGFEIKK
ncbi:MAG: Ryanodine receptor Ryr [Prevotellaceae bacterium]|jgi:hypothetical protein|nr:Ryanodine receptor Ryr [Prevotellaceae bacterium]